MCVLRTHFSCLQVKYIEFLHVNDNTNIKCNAIKRWQALIYTYKGYAVYNGRNVSNNQNIHTIFTQELYSEILSCYVAIIFAIFSALSA